jgi:3'(2'), 5'-bisphosphate nucleotidase
MDDHELALALAHAAGRRLLEVRERTEGDAPAQVKAAGDRASQELLAELLRRTRPDDRVLSEEAADDPRRLQADRVWIIDPLDGTREFSEPGRWDWAVHVALWERGVLVAGAVDLPAAGRSFGTAAPLTVPEPAPGPLRLAVSRTRPPAFVQALAEHLGAELVPMGSAGVKATSVLRGEADAYVHAGGQYEWDSAAPVAVAAAAGLHTSRIDGSPLVYNRADPMLPDLVVCRRQDAASILDAIAAISEPEDALA